jgi:flagellin
MPSILSTNMASLYAQRSLATAQADVATSVQRLSSGKRINSAKDDAAGLGISEGIAGVRNISDQSIRNLQNAGSLVQTAEGALDVVNKILQRALTLTTQKNDATLNADQQSVIDGEINSLLAEIGRIRERTKFNSSDTIFGAFYSFGSGPGVTTSFTIPELTIPALGLNGQISSASVDSVSLARVAQGTVNLSSLVQSSGTTLDHGVQGTVVGLSTLDQSSATTSDKSVQGVVAQVYSTSIIDFSKSGSAVAGNKFNIPNNNFANGDEVIYRKGSGDPIGPFNNGQHYFVKNVDGDTFQLSATSDGSVIDFTSLGSSSNADFLKVSALPVDISSVGINATTTSTLQISQNWNDGDKVFFAIGAANAGFTGGLEDGKVYTVSDSTPNSVTLLDYSGQAVTFSFSDNLQGSTLQWLGSNPSVRVLSNSEVKAPYHGFSGGEKVFYSGLDQGGLTHNTVYYVSILSSPPRSLNDKRDYFRLAPTAPDAVAKTNLITIPNLNSNNNFYWAPPSAIPEGSFQSNPVLPANSLVMNDTSFQPNDLVFYHQGTDAIGGLTDGDLYYVVTASNNAIQLSRTQGSAAIELGPFSSLTGANLQKVSSQLVFNSGAPGTVFLGDTISSSGHGFQDNDIVYYHQDDSNPISGLIDNTPYHVINATSNTFQLSETQGGQAIKFSSLGGNNQVFTPSTITLRTQDSHAFQSGDEVLYQAGATSISPLVDGTHYIIRNAGSNSFQLSEVNSETSISFTGSGSAGDQLFSRIPNVIVSTGHGFQDGDSVYYGSTGDAIPELANGGPYFVRNRNNDAFQLSATNDVNAPIINFSDLGSGIQSFTLNTNYIDASGNAFSDGQEVIYNSNGGSPISPLVDGNHYIIRNNDGNKFQLSAVNNSSIIDISSAGGQAVSFSSIPSSNTVFATGHGFSNNQEVIYNVEAGGTNIPELQDGTHYLIKNAQSNSFQLSAVGDPTIINFTGTGIDAQYFTLDTNYIDAFDNSFSNGQEVIYNSNGGSPISPLVDGNHYIIRNNDSTKFQLSAVNNSSIIDISSAGGQAVSFSSIPSSNRIDSSGNGFSTGDEVVYDASGTQIDGLVSGTHYIVRNAQPNSFQLSAVGDPTIINFTGAGAGTQSFTLNTDIINSDGHGFSTGDEVVYSANGGAVIGGLSEGGHYFVIKNDDNSFELSATNGGSAINLTSTGDGVFTHQSAAISVSSISNAITINSSHRAELGALSNSISYAIDNLQTLSSNLSDAYGRIVDTDYASETANLTRGKILQQASAAMLAQANQMPNVILSLLK